MQVVSDLHLEFRKEFRQLIKPSAPILVLLGDICACANEEDYAMYRKFMKYIVKKFKHVIHVPGNHEYYVNGCKPRLQDTIQGVDNKLRQFAKGIPNLSFLNNDVVRIRSNGRKYCFIGSTLWSEIDKAMYKTIQRMMSDYSEIYVDDIRRYTPEDMSVIHKKSVKFIQSSIKKIKPDEIGVLLTHHKPIKDCEDRFSMAYESDLAHIIKPPLKLAAHGHTHKKYDKIINGVRVISNPKGYPHEKTNYDNSYTLF